MSRTDQALNPLYRTVTVADYCYEHRIPLTPDAKGLPECVTCEGLIADYIDGQIDTAREEAHDRTDATGVHHG